MSEPLLRAIRGATTVQKNESSEILAASRELLEKIALENDLVIEDIVSAFFTMTPDLDAEFPAVAARGLGWNHIPLLCSQEIPVQGSLPHCIRVLIHLYTKRTPDSIRHLYLRQAAVLRPDLASTPQ
ncbi:MAG TPA: chorismate mutase [Cyanobacteria bacterium UBA8530]|nr:chorismate mutase [Cyanobacteria bacterium UBA8530]